MIRTPFLPTRVGPGQLAVGNEQGTNDSEGVRGLGSCPAVWGRRALPDVLKVCYRPRCKTATQRPSHGKDGHLSGVPLGPFSS